MLFGDTLLERCDTGEAIAIRDLAGHEDVGVFALDERLKLGRSLLTCVRSVGDRPVLRMTLASGRSVAATSDHGFLTVSGWKRIGELAPGDALATARALPDADQATRWPEHEIVMLAHLLGDGCVSRDPIYYCSRDEANLEVVEKAAAEFGVTTTGRPDVVSRTCTSR